MIGSGNSQRSDDGVGPSVAEAARQWSILGVVALSARQLTPEMAATLYQAQGQGAVSPPLGTGVKPDYSSDHGDAHEAKAPSPEPGQSRHQGESVS